MRYLTCLVRPETGEKRVFAFTKHGNGTPARLSPHVNQPRYLEYMVRNAQGRVLNASTVSAHSRVGTCLPIVVKVYSVKTKESVLLSEQKLKSIGLSVP